MAETEDEGTGDPGGSRRVKPEAVAETPVVSALRYPYACRFRRPLRSVLPEAPEWMMMEPMQCQAPR